MIICDQPSGHLLSKDDCPITSGITTNHHIEWFNEKLEFSTFLHLALVKDSVRPLVSAVTTVKDAKICQDNFVVVHVHDDDKKSSTKKNFLAMVTTSVGDYITVMYLRGNRKRFSTDDKEE